MAKIFISTLVVVLLNYILLSHFSHAQEYGQKMEHLEIRKLEGKKARFAYQVSLVLLAPVSDVYTVLTDYNHLNALDDLIKESRIINFPEVPIIVETISHDCIFVFCFTVKHTQKVILETKERIELVTIADESDYSYGHMTWSLYPYKENTKVDSKTKAQIQSAKSLLVLHVEIEPSFWLPPILGEGVFDNKIQSGLVTFFNNLKMHLE